MASERVLVYSSDKAYLVEILKEVFSDHGISSFSINKQDRNYLFGEIELYVLQDDVIRAKRLIREFEDKGTDKTES